MKYLEHSARLLELLATDQKEWKEFARAEFVDKISTVELDARRHVLRERVTIRAREAMKILELIREPSIGNIGAEAAQALSILATHHSLATTRKVLESFEALYQKAPEETFKQSIPAMTDWLAVLQNKPQKFATIWLFDDKQYPFLPTVQDIENVNARREAYGIGPLRWPRSLVLPEKDQPWLQQPISEAVTREPTSSELAALGNY